jgi:vanillate monooxygenase ferredoxin subunit
MSLAETERERVYDVHVFCCINERAPDHPRSSCSARGSIELHKYMKARAKELGIKSIRVNKAGCMERCELGPVLVIYPEAAWYRFDTTEDIDDILCQHIIDGNPVERLALKTSDKTPEPRTEPRLRLRIEGIKRLTRQIMKFELVAENGGELPVFTAGSHIDIFTPDDLRRSYSLACAPDQRQRYVIAVLRERNGRGGSAWIHDSLALDDIIETSYPKSNFALNEHAKHHLLIAGGIGITPLLSMGWRLKQLNASATLHYCARGPETTSFADEVKETFGDHVFFHHDGGNPDNGIDLKQVLADPVDGACLYICGPAGLIDAARAAAAHWPDGSVHFERFSADSQDPTHLSDDEAFDIILSRQGLTLNVPPGKSILDVVQEAGIKVDSSCEQGVCGSCSTRLLAGESDHRDSFLSTQEQARQDTIMICSSRAKSGETLILDI